MLADVVHRRATADLSDEGAAVDRSAIWIGVKDIAGGLTSNHAAASEGLSASGVVIHRCWTSAAFAIPSAALPGSGLRFHWTP
jgi:hypothetical protein